MLKFDLKGAILEYEAKTGLRITYTDLSKLTGISQDTIKSLASRDDYNATLMMISQVCSALNVSPLKFFDWPSETQVHEKKN